MERRAGDCFLDCYFATRPPRNWPQKYLRENQLPNRLVEQRSVQQTCELLLRRVYGVLGEILWESKFRSTSLYVLER